VWTIGPTTPLRDGHEILTSKQIVTVVFEGLPRITLLCPHGFTRRMIVTEICSTLQKTEFRSDDRFLEHITLENGLVTFRLGSYGRPNTVSEPNWTRCMAECVRRSRCSTRRVAR
jgi:hypothetical protein